MWQINVDIFITKNRIPMYGVHRRIYLVFRVQLVGSRSKNAGSHKISKYMYSLPKNLLGYWAEKKVILQWKHSCKQALKTDGQLWSLNTPLDWQLRTVHPNTEVFLRSLWLCWKSRFEFGLLISKKKIGASGTFFRDNCATIILKAVKCKAMYKSCMAFFFSKLKLNILLSLKNAWLPPLFVLDTKNSC